MKFGSRRDAVPDFEIDMSLPAFDFYEGADLTAWGRPLKTDKQITPPLNNAAPLWDGSIVCIWEEIRVLARLKFRLGKDRVNENLNTARE